MVQPKEDSTTSQTYSGSPEHHRRQTVQTQTGDSDRVVSPPGYFQTPLSEVGLTRSRLVCNKVQPQTAQVRVSGSGQVSLEGRCLESSLGGPGCLCFSSDSHSGSGGDQIAGDHGCHRIILIAPG